MKSIYIPEWNTFIRYHEISGEGITQVYLPGLCMPSLEQFLSVVTHPDMAGHHSLLIDYIGSGWSDHSQEFDYSIENHAHSVAIILDNERVNDSIIVGYSMGGTVGIKLAIMRPDLVSNLIIAEANISPGGGDVTKRIASYSEEKYLDDAHRAFLEESRKAAIKGNKKAAFIHAAWSRCFPVGLYRSSVALVELDDAFEAQFKNMSISRTFIYGEKSLPKNRDEVRPDAPDPDELREFDIEILIVPKAGHAMMLDNLQGFVTILKQAVQKDNQQ